jgi:hypothetical protein
MWQEIERKIARGGLTEAEQEDLWDCLFLTLPQITPKNGRLPFPGSTTLS